ncbi:MAG TPA: HAMP domain-containing sensor histidine kinase [Rhizomicrobium sp.]|nr:HAMP domain-containing sensor histidine kinase [Rhizomicrobium sp.]
MPVVLRFGAEPMPAEADFALLFDHLPDPVVYLGPELTVRACNRKFRERFPVLIESQFVAPLRALLAEKRPSDDPVNLPILRPTSRSIWPGKKHSALEPRVSWMPEGGALIVFRPVGSDEAVYHQQIQHLCQQMAEVQQQASNARLAVEAYKERLSVTSHELRTPLNAIIGFSDVMRQELFGPLGDPRYQRYAELLHDSGSRLLEMINDVLDLSKLDAGKLQLHTRTIEVFRVIVDSVRELEVLAAKSRVCFGVHVFDGVSLLVADDKRLRQMMLNLLSNALKFTPPGGEISIDVYRRGANIAISVADTGVGMREEDIATALEPFGQVENQAVNSQGTGLGLPLTKQLAELHGGTLEMESQPGRGTTVTILLPEQGGRPGKSGRPDRDRNKFGARPLPLAG